MEIAEEHAPVAAQRDLIGRHLGASNHARMPRLTARFQHAFFLKDTSGEIMGGLWADCMLDWVYVDLLFVPETERGKGTGKELMALIETRAREWQSKGIWLLTFEFQARGFYEKLGYTCFGTLDGMDATTNEYFMRKYLR